MSLLNFLRVLEGIQPKTGSDSPPPRNRRLELEALEDRSVFTLFGLPLPPLLPIQVPIVVPGVVLPPIIAPEPPATPVLPPPDDGESGSGTGGPGDPGDVPPPEPPLTDGSSGSGTGDPPTDPLPGYGSGSGTGTSGSGSGTGTSGSGSGTGSSGSGSGSAAPAITSLESQGSGLWVWFTGTVSDADGPVEGLTVYFTIGQGSLVSFTTTVRADGTFESMELMIGLGTLISAYTIDAQGNHSSIATCTA